jgi:hypothetical protein
VLVNLIVRLALSSRQAELERAQQVAGGGWRSGGGGSSGGSRRDRGNCCGSVCILRWSLLLAFLLVVV